MSGQIMTETDGAAGDIGPPIPLPGGDVPIPPRAAPQRQREPEFNIIETDSDFNPIASPQPQPEQPQQVQQPATETQQPEAERQFRARSPAERRASQREKRDETKAALRAAQEELATLREMVQGIEPRLSEIDAGRRQQQISEIDRQIGEAKRLKADAHRRLTEALSTSDHESITAALEARDQAIASESRLSAEKDRMATLDPGPRRPASQYQPQAPVAPPLTQQAREYLSDFQADHGWLRVDQSGRPMDLDTQIALALDAEVARDGFNPSTQEYWEELTERIARYIPHRAPQQSAPPQQQRQAQQPAPQPPPVERRGPMMAGGSDRAPSGGDNTVYLSPGRKETLILAGVLERDGRTVVNPTKFRSYLAQYQAYDRANGVARQ